MAAYIAFTEMSYFFWLVYAIAVIKQAANEFYSLYYKEKHDQNTLSSIILFSSERSHPGYYDNSCSRHTRTVPEKGAGREPAVCDGRTCQVIEFPAVYLLMSPGIE